MPNGSPITASLPDITPGARPSRAPATWSGLLTASATAVAVAAVLTQAAGRFFGPSFALLAVLAGVGAWLAGRRPRAAAWLAGLACLLNLALHGGMLVMVARAPGQGLAVVLDAVNVVGSVLATAAAVAILAGRAGGALPRRLAVVGVALVGLAAVLTTSLYLTRTSVEPSGGEVVVRHSGLSVAPADVVVTTEDGAATLVVRNDDPIYPRSFDIDEIDVHLVVPPRTGVRVELPATPATYEFYDFFTFTAATEGTVTVRDDR